MLTRLKTVNWVFLQHVKSQLGQSCVVGQSLGNQFFLEGWEVMQSIFKLVLLDFVKQAFFSSLSCSVSPDATEKVNVSEMLTVLELDEWISVLCVELDCALVDQKHCLTEFFVLIDFISLLKSDLFKISYDTPCAIVF